MNVYFIPGLGANQKIFCHIRLPDPFVVCHLHWITPGAREPLPSYAERLAAAIDTSKPFSLVGLSFGGMLAMEIGARLQPRQTILISSITSPGQLPTAYRLAGKLGLHRVIPVSLFQQISLLKRFITRESPEEKQILKSMIRSCDPQFIRWAMGAALNWKPLHSPGNLVHIHGTADEILPFRHTRPTHTIEGGRHLMVLQRAREINRILEEVLSSEE